MILFTEFLGKVMELQIKELSSLILFTNTSQLVKLQWISPKICHILSNAAKRAGIVYPEISSPLVI